MTLSAAKLEKIGSVNFGISSSELSWSTHPEMLMACGTSMPL